MVKTRANNVASKRARKRGSYGGGDTEIEEHEHEENIIPAKIDEDIASLPKRAKCLPTFNGSVLKIDCSESRETLSDYVICLFKHEGQSPCMKCFNSKLTLSHHRAEEHWKTVFKCTRCSFQTTKNGTYQTHFKRQLSCNKSLHGVKESLRPPGTRLPPTFKVIDYCRAVADHLRTHEHQRTIHHDIDFLAGNPGEANLRSDDILQDENNTEENINQSQLKNSVEYVVEKMDSHSETVSQLAKELEEMKFTVKTQQEQLNQNQDEIKNLKQRIESEIRETFKRDDKIKELISRDRRIQNNLEASLEENELKQSMIVYRDGQITNLEDELKQTREKMQELLTKVAQLEAENNVLHSHSTANEAMNEVKDSKECCDSAPSEPVLIDLTGINQEQSTRLVDWQNEYKVLKLAVNQAVSTCNVNDLPHLVHNNLRYKTERDELRRRLLLHKHCPFDPSVAMTDDQMKVLMCMLRYVNIMNKSKQGYSFMRKEIDSTRQKDGLQPLKGSPSKHDNEVYGNDWTDLRSSEEREYVLSFLHGYAEIPSTINRTDGTQRPAVLDGMNLAYGYLTVPEVNRVNSKGDRKGYYGIYAIVKLLTEKMGLEDNQITIVMPFHHVFDDLKKKLFTHEVIKLLYERQMILAMPTRNTLEDIIKHGQLDDYDDLVILMMARNSGGFVISNDLYRDIWEEDSIYAATKFKFVARKRRVSFLFDRDGAPSLLIGTKDEVTLKKMTTFVMESNETEDNIIQMNEARRKGAIQRGLRHNE